MLTKCENCKYGDINFWAYEECWKFNQSPDFTVTKNTAIREKHATEFNKDRNCQYYEPKNKWQKFKDSLRRKNEKQPSNE